MTRETMDPNFEQGAKGENMSDQTSKATAEGISAPHSIQDFIARVIDPEGHEEFDLALKNNDVEKQNALLPRLRMSCLKADIIVQNCVPEVPAPTTLYHVIADIRHKSGVGVRPMLGELADAIKQRIDDAAKAFPENISEDDVERATKAWMRSYANGVHDNYYPNDPNKNDDGMTTSDKLWEATSSENKEYAMRHVRAALTALVPTVATAKTDNKKPSAAKRKKVAK